MLRWLLVLACTASCGSSRTPVVSVERMRVEPEPGRESPTHAVLPRIADYHAWVRLGAVSKSAAHDGLWLAVHLDALAASAASDGVFPEGSIIVAENRAEPDGPPVTLTTMVKRAEGWHWIEHGPDGTVHKAGELDGCVRCHRNAVSSDMVFFRADEPSNE